MKYYAIIVAGGKGTRLGGGIPKQFRLLNGRPMLMYTIDAFFGARRDINVIVVLPEEHIGYWQSLCDEYGFNPKYSIAKGGGSRWESVRNGLALVAESGIVAVHDGARPLVSPALINTAFDTAERFGSAVPAVAPVDSMRIIDKDGNSRILDRDCCRCIQTPQVFRSEILVDAYRLPFSECYTDDASVVESAGGTIKLIDGEKNNIKVTALQDISLAEIILNGG